MNRRLPTLIVPSLVMALSLSAAGQDTKPKAIPSPAPTQEKPAALPAGALTDAHLIDLEFPGGTFGDFTELVQKTATPRANFVVSPTILQAAGTPGLIKINGKFVLSRDLFKPAEADAKPQSRSTPAGHTHG
jgi:hypothetical protein